VALRVALPPGPAGGNEPQPQGVDVLDIGQYAPLGDRGEYHGRQRQGDRGDEVA
jgi:hypothetical protein